MLNKKRTWTEKKNYIQYVSTIAFFFFSFFFFKFFLFFVSTETGVAPRRISDGLLTATPCYTRASCKIS